MILVTGGSGLVGTELISRLLEQGKKVTAIFHHSLLSITHKNLVVFECDILDTEGLHHAMKGVEQVYHCAGFVSFTPKNKNKLFYI